MRANETLRSENNSMATEVAALRAKLAKTERDEDQWKAQEQKVAEFTKRNLLLETEN